MADRRLTSNSNRSIKRVRIGWVNGRQLDTLFAGETALKAIERQPNSGDVRLGGSLGLINELCASEVLEVLRIAPDAPYEDHLNV
jgi:hypothetical protein